MSLTVCGISGVLILLMSEQAIAQSAAEKKMNRLTAQWYNAVVSGLKLDAAKFQLVQGNTAVGATSDSVWAFFDLLPPRSVSHYNKPERIRSFSQTYGALINSLMPYTAQGMRTLLANSYLSWETYSSHPENLPLIFPMDEAGNVDFTEIRVMQFAEWSRMNGIDTRTRKAGITLLKQTDALATAMTQWTAVNGKFAYTASVDDVLSQVSQGHARSASMDSKVSSSDVKRFRLLGGVEGIYDIFGGETAGEWSVFTSHLRAAGLQISASFDRVGTVLGGPYDLKSQHNPNLHEYSPWFNESALRVAKINNNKKVWKNSQPKWEQMFGRYGTMQRRVSGLVAVDGVTVTMTSTYSVPKADQSRVRAKFAEGFFPFFGAEGKGGWSNFVQFNNDGTFRAVSTSQRGNPQIIGVLVEPIDQSLTKAEAKLIRNSLILGKVVACNQVSAKELGKCRFDNSDLRSRMNCPTCCAQRKALLWISRDHKMAC